MTGRSPGPGSRGPSLAVDMLSGRPQLPVRAGSAAAAGPADTCWTVNLGKPGW